MKKIDINDINFDLKYEGYYWYSNQQKPELVLNQTITKDIFTILPFVVEGNLYSKEKGISINIKNIDGEYKVFQADVKDLSDEQITRNEYLAHDLAGIDKIKMIHFWEESKEDALLENMKTLIPAWQAFVGFINK
jgi:CRISPR type III-associated protein (TIGR04423 family)